MPAQIPHYAVTVPVTATPSAPQITQMQLGQFVPSWVEVEVPAGCNGEVGWYIAASGVEYLPYNPGGTPTWVVTTGRVVHWDLVNAPTGGDFQLYAYNSGGYAHLLQVTWGLDLLTAHNPVNAAATPLSNTALAGG